MINLVIAVLPGEVVPRLQAAIDRRNFLAHRFWYERIELMTTSEGVSKLIVELSEYTAEFQALNADIDKCVEPYMSRADVTDEMVQRALASLLRGEPEEPMIRQRRPKRRELIVAVYDVPVEGGGSAPVFQTDDGTLWQLCDAGLGWTACHRAEASWRPPFGPGAALVVRPGGGRGEFRWGIRRATTQAPRE